MASLPSDENPELAPGQQPINRGNINREIIDVELVLIALMKKSQQLELLLKVDSDKMLGKKLHPLHGFKISWIM